MLDTKNKIYIAFALLESGKPLFGLEIIDFINSKCIKKQILLGSIYNTLRSMQKGGAILELPMKRSSKGGGNTKVYYKLSKSGKKEIKEILKFLR